MAYKNRAELMGNLGRDFELFHTPTGKVYVKGSMATNERWTNSAGEKVVETTWFNLRAWGKLAEALGKWGKKGRRVDVEGRFRTEKYDDHGVTKWYNYVLIDRLQFLDAPEGDEQEEIVEPEGLEPDLEPELTL